MIAFLLRLLRALLALLRRVLAASLSIAPWLTGPISRLVAAIRRLLGLGPAPAAGGPGAGGAGGGAGGGGGAVTPPPPPPVVHSFTPPDNIGQQIPLRLVAKDPENERLTVRAEFSFNNSAFRPAKAAIGSDRIDDPTTPIAAPHLGADYRFIWDAFADLSALAGITSVPPGGSPALRGNAVLRLTPSAGSRVGAPADTTSFAVDANPLPPPAPYRPPAPVTPDLDRSPQQKQIGIVNAQLRKGAVGKLLPEPFRVRVLDQPGGNPVAGARVHFRVLPGAPPVTLERDPQYAPTTDGAGYAAIRVRPVPGVPGSGTIEAQVVGAPDPVAKFEFELRAPRLHRGNIPTGPVTIGQATDLEVWYDADADRNTQDFLGERCRPIRLKLEGTDVQLPRTELRLDARTGNVARFTVVPTIRSGKARVVVSDADDSTVTPLPIEIDVTQRPNARRVRGGATTVTDQVTMILEPLPQSVWASPLPTPSSGSTTTAPTPTNITVPVGYPGVTIGVPMNVRIVDTATPANEYKEQVTANFDDCTKLEDTRALPITYQASGGTLSDQKFRGPSSSITVPYGTDVWFTPENEGPWFITAIAGPNIADPLRRSYQWTTHGATHCRRQSTIGTPNSYTLVVQPPSLVFHDANTAKAIEEPLKPGDRILVHTEGISSCGGGGPRDATLETLLASGSPAPTYTGLRHPLKQSVQMLSSLNPSGPIEIESDEILVVQGEPNISGQLTHAAIPGGWIAVTIGGTEHAAPVLARVADRVAIEDVESIFESPTGTSPMDGVADTVNVRNGEFLYTVCDLDIPTRADPLMLERTYRSQSRSDGPLGPGWSSPHMAFLDASNDRWLRWVTGSGRYDDITGGPPGALGRGVFAVPSRERDVDANKSAFVLTDPHKNTIHFNPDGTLRFTRDRMGNIVRYEYDAKGRLSEIHDIHDRVLKLEYHTSSSAPKAVGKLWHITDFTSNKRQVTFEYYGGSHPASGWLSRVLQPEAPTVVSGNLEPKYRRAESYEYEIDPSDRLRGRLTKILDSLGTAWLENKYDKGRVQSQENGVDPHTGAKRGYAFGYTAASATALASSHSTDPVETTVRYTFPRSPHPDAAAPSSVVIVANPKLGGTKDRTQALVHNYDGLLVSHTLPSGDQATYVYDDDRANAPLNRGNLLVVRHRGTKGEERVWTFEYTRQFNFVRRSVEPRGNAPGINAAMYATRYTYDHQTGVGNMGNLVRLSTPRTLNLIITDPPGGASTSGLGSSYQLWIEENCAIELTYNSLGQLLTHTDPHSVITTFSYYGSSAPTGPTSGAGAAAPAGGGFLAESARDTVVSASRNLHLKGVPPQPLVRKYRYDEYGNIREVEEDTGLVSKYTVSPLQELVAFEEEVRAGHGAPALTHKHELSTSHLGLLTDAKCDQSNTIAGVTGSLEDHWEIDVNGDPHGGSSTHETPHDVDEHCDSDACGDTIAAVPFDAKSHCSDSAGGVALDEIGLPAVIKEGVPGATPTAAGYLETTIARSPNGAQMEHKAPGASRSFKYELDGFDDPIALLDPMKNVLRGLPDAEGLCSRLKINYGEAGGNSGANMNPTGAPLGRFHEARIDEMGRFRRSHRGLFAPDAPGAAASPQHRAVPKAAEYVGSGDLVTERVRMLDDGRWGSGDGRSTQDVAYDAMSCPTRLVDDELGFVFIRRDAQSRPYRIEYWTGERPGTLKLASVVKHDYTSASETKLTVEEYSTDGSYPNPLVISERMEYDSSARLTRVTDGEGNARRWEYDEIGHMQTAYDPGAQNHPTDTFNGQPVSVDGALSTYERDGLGAVTRAATQASGVDAKYTADGRLLSVTDAANNEIEWKWDKYGRLESVHYPKSAASPTSKPHSMLRYHTSGPGIGRLERATLPNGKALEYDYDDVGRVTEVRATGPGQNESFAIAYAGNIATATSRAGRAIAMELDSASRLAREVQDGVEVRSRHDGAGNRIALKYPSKPGEVIYEYDNGGRLRSMRDPSAPPAVIQYLGRSRVLSRTFNLVTARAEWWDKAGRLIRSRISGLAGPEIVFEVLRDRLGRIERRTRTSGSSVERRVWEYDLAGRIHLEAFTPGPPRATGTLLTQLTYDDDGVVLKEERDVQIGGGAINRLTWTMTREERGRIVTRTGAGAGPLAYDKAGNLLNDGTNDFEYDSWNRLVRVRGGANIDYTYDAAGRLVRRVTPTSTESYIYDQWHLIEVRGERPERYVYSDQTDDIIFAEIGDRRYTYLYTPEGWVDSIVDEQGNIVESYDYTLSGKCIVLDAQRRPTHTDPISRFIFQRRPWDRDTGLYHYRTRWYHPIFGQFTTPDSLGVSSGPNQYALNQGDPVNYCDPYGTEDEPSGVHRRRRRPEPVMESAWAAAWDGFKEGFTGGASILANTFTFGGTDKWGLTNSEAYQGTEYTIARGTALVSREALITAATLGVGHVARGGVEGAKWSARGINALARSNRIRRGATWATQGLAARDIAVGGYSVGTGVNQVSEGHILSGVFSILAGALGMGGGFTALRGLRAPAGVPTTPPGSPPSVPRALSSAIEDMRTGADPLRPMLLRPVPVGFSSLEEFEATFRKIATGAANSSGPVGGLFGMGRAVRGLMRAMTPGIGLKGNAAVATGIIDGKTILRPASSRLLGRARRMPLGFPPATKTPEALTLPWRRWIRGTRGYTHTEFKILEQIIGNTTKQSKGVIRLFTERLPCPSCWEAIRKFQSERKGITVIVTNQF